MPDAPVTEDPAPEELKPAESEKDSEPKEEVNVQAGRRRGRRQVMKKKTVKDEEGYLGAYSAVLEMDYTLTHLSYSHD